jgi:hypothetical protein
MSNHFSDNKLKIYYIDHAMYSTGIRGRYILNIMRNDGYH